MPATVAMHYVPNALTIARILLTPAVLALMLTPTFYGQAGALTLFLAASVSDYFDGELARRMGARSRLGTFLDPLADKVLVLGTFAVLAVTQPQVVPWWAVAVIALRDVVVTAVRVRAEARGRTVRTSRAAKWKTTVQLVFLISMLLLATAVHVRPGQAAATWLLHESILLPLALAVVVLFTVATGVLYFYYPTRWTRHVPRPSLKSFAPRRAAATRDPAARPESAPRSDPAPRPEAPSQSEPAPPPEPAS